MLVVNRLVSDQKHEVLQILSAERSVLVRIGQVKDIRQQLPEFWRDLVVFVDQELQGAEKCGVNVRANKSVSYVT